jgi:hypothetical protein
MPLKRSEDQNEQFEDIVDGRAQEERNTDLESQRVAIIAAYNASTRRRNIAAGGIRHGDGCRVSDSGRRGRRSYCASLVAQLILLEATRATVTRQNWPSTTCEQLEKNDASMLPPAAKIALLKGSTALENSVPVAKLGSLTSTSTPSCPRENVCRPEFQTREAYPSRKSRRNFCGWL